MRREFIHSLGKVTNSKPAVLREAYRRLTGDCSACDSQDQAQVDARVAELHEHAWDLRQNSSGCPEKFGVVLFQHWKYYTDAQVETAVTGEVIVGLKENAFQPSSPIRHMTELSNILLDVPEKPTLLLHTDGGPDHRLTYRKSHYF